jgi:hypothetical protein
MEITLFLAALGLGFASGFHCIGMCGPIALSLGLSKQQQVNFHLQNFTYQLGRIITYTFLGAIVGIVGEGFQMAGFQKYISIFAGALLIVMALFSFGGDFASKIPAVNNALLKVKINLGKLLQKSDYSSRFLTGILNGFLPCGMVYMALWQSATFMAVFGLGTFPFMFAVVFFGNLINTATRAKILKFIPIFMLVLGGLFILRGLELGIPYVSPKKEVLKVEKRMNAEQGSDQNCH